MAVHAFYEAERNEKRVMLPASVVASFAGRRRAFDIDKRFRLFVFLDLRLPCRDILEIIDDVGHVLPILNISIEHCRSRADGRPVSSGRRYRGARNGTVGGPLPLRASGITVPNRNTPCHDRSIEDTWFAEKLAQHSWC